MLRGDTREGSRVLTVDWTTEQRMSSTERVSVDSGTHAGNQVPVGEF